MQQYRFLTLTALMAGVTLFSSCSDDDPEPVVVPPTESGIIEVDGGGATYPNTAYIQFRTGTQTAVARESWDLAFATGSEFKVLINGTTGAMASATGETDINVVSSADMSAADSAALVLSFTNLEGILHVDDPSMPLSKPAIAAVNSTEASNEVYILSRGASGVEAKSLKKIRITRNGEGYTLQHADADAADFISVDVVKDNDHNFVYFSFENGIVDVEPAKDSWDISWTAGTSSTPYPAATTGILAYFFQDLVYQNIYGGVGAASVLEADIAYADFTEQDVNSLTFDSSDRLAIGSTWRNGGGPTSSPAVKDDIYYIIKDADENIYKVRFLSLTKDGERGKPSLEFELVSEDL
ncbi:HmuY family protein [Algoriphagus winogradskyi]|uniref:HmuY protein n=1 Tax=Algoriphagus winogradskyi TaxID=237017 RepID=A0ABY1NQF8_9BACT|nr:HmuY family protein [Algoriphagus winogradskyi]SMP14918.1 HmuY protein [Algoriphagus winogradskyi]